MATIRSPLYRNALRVMFVAMPTEKRSTTYRLSEDARQLVALVAEKLGVSQTDVLELAIREKAKRERVALPGAPAARAKRKR